MPIKKTFIFDKEPVYIMDGNAFIFRGYFANSKMTRSDSFPTGAMYIVGRILLKILREELPKYFIFVLDGQGPHFRHELFPEYKAQRPSAPEELKAQFAPIKRMLEQFGIKVEVSCACEADDCIASLAKRYSKERPVVIIGMDKDLRQCLNNNVIMWDPATKEEKILTEQDFKDNTGLHPNQWADVQALIGDASDNIPGVRGIGEKTAMKLFQDFPNLESIRDNYEDLPLPVKKKMEGNLDIMFLYRKLTTLNTEQCLDISLDDMTIQDAHEQNALTFFKEFELHGLAKDFKELVRKNVINIIENSGEQGSLNSKPSANALLVGENQEQNSSENNQEIETKIEPEIEAAPLLEINFVENLPDCTDKVLALIKIEGDKKDQNKKDQNKEEGIYIALAPLPKSVDFLRALALSENGHKTTIAPMLTNEVTSKELKHKTEAKTQKTNAKNSQQSLFALIEKEASPVPKSLNMVEEAAKILALPTEGKIDIF